MRSHVTPVGRARALSLCLGLSLALGTTGCEKLIHELLDKEGEGGRQPEVVAGRAASEGSGASDDAPPPTATAASAGANAGGGAGGGANAGGGASGGVGAATAQAPARPGAPVATASPAQLERVFASLDINSDEQLDGVEVKRCGCASADANGDGEITKAEYLAAGLLGKLGPAPTPTAPAPATTPAAPTPAAPTPPTPPPTTPPAPVAGGLPPGKYPCFGLVGSSFSARGTLVIVDGARYAHGTDGSGGGTYVFDPGTKKIRFTSGLFADPSQVTDAKQISAQHIQMRTGKGGFYTWDCKR